jgi:hypothetical protein
MNKTVKVVQDAKVTVIKNADGVLQLRLFGTGFGNTEHKDFHGEFFTKGTDFSDDILPVKAVNYDHLPPEWMANPFASRELKTQPIGTAKLVEETEEGRWYEVEIMKAKEYHEYFMKLADQGLLGASTQCMPGGRVSLPNGEITHWAETAIALTVQPSNSDTLDKIHEIAKSTGMPMMEAIEESLHQKVLDDAAAEAEQEEENDENNENDENKDDNTTEIHVDVEGITNAVTDAAEKAAVAAVVAALEEPLKIIDEVSKSLTEAVKIIGELTSNEEFKSFVSEFKKNTDELNRRLGAVAFTLSKKAQDKLNGAGPNSRIFGKDTKRNVEDVEDQDADDEDENVEDPSTENRKSKLPAGFPGTGS